MKFFLLTASASHRSFFVAMAFDPTKWLIWTLSKLGLTRNLRRIPADKIESAQAQTRNASC